MNKHLSAFIVPFLGSTSSVQKAIAYYRCMHKSRSCVHTSNVRKINHNVPPIHKHISRETNIKMPSRIILTFACKIILNDTKQKCILNGGQMQ